MITVFPNIVVIKLMRGSEQFKFLLLWYKSETAVNFKAKITVSVCRIILDVKRPGLAIMRY